MMWTCDFFQGDEENNQPEIYPLILISMDGFRWDYTERTDTPNFDILIENKRVDILQDVAKKYTFLFDQMNKTEVATVTTAVPLTKELEAKVLAKVKELTGNDVSLENKIDESIIGGFILRVGDLQYNASIANKLNTLKREFTNNTYVSKL